MVVNKLIAEALQKIQMIVNMPIGIHLLFMWNYTLYFNRCRIRMTKRFSFNDTYLYYIFNFTHEPKITFPLFLNKKVILRICEKKLIKKNKTIFLSPNANSVYGLSPLFWNLLGYKLTNKGYKIICNINDENEKKLYYFPTVFPSYTESVPMLEYCGSFIGLRSGFCDIISSAKCKKIILYPKQDEYINYSEHRSDIEFSGLNHMGLCNNSIEIDSIIIKNITDKPRNFNKVFIMNEYNRIIRLILKNFSPLGGKNNVNIKKHST